MNKYLIYGMFLWFSVLCTQQESCIPSVLRNPFKVRTAQESPARLVTASLHNNGTEIEFFSSCDGVKRRIVYP